MLSYSVSEKLGTHEYGLGDKIRIEIKNNNKEN